MATKRRAKQGGGLVVVGDERQRHWLQKWLEYLKDSICLLSKWGKSNKMRPSSVCVCLVFPPSNSPTHRQSSNSSFPFLSYPFDLLSPQLWDGSSLLFRFQSSPPFFLPSLTCITPLQTAISTSPRFQPLNPVCLLARHVGSSPPWY